MKIELQFLNDPHDPYDNENLAFTFWKRDVKTILEKKKIVSMICHLYHMWCVDSRMNTDDLDEILSEITYAKVGFVVQRTYETDNPNLYIFNANKKAP